MKKAQHVPRNYHNSNNVRNGKIIAPEVYIQLYTPLKMRKYRIQGVIYEISWLDAWRTYD